MKTDTPADERRLILETPHLRTLDVENWLYYSYDRKGKQIVLDNC